MKTFKENIQLVTPSLEVLEMMTQLFTQASKICNQISKQLYKQKTKLSDPSP
jgi:hypothetical protein